MASRAAKTTSNTTETHIWRLPGLSHPAEAAVAAHKTAPPA
ncbi:hypothetical protein [Streptomyces sp. NPDC012466]